MKNRKSGLELLRIICMILIIFHHYSVHGEYPVFTCESINIAQVFIQECSMLGRVACSIFAIISGYFLIENSGKNHYRKIVPLIAEIVCLYLLVGIAVYIFQPFEFSVRDFVQFMTTIITTNWYVVYYILWYLFIPFANRMLKTLSRKQYMQMLGITLLIWSVIPTFATLSVFTTIPFSSWTFGPFDFFIVMYVLGGFLRLHISNEVIHSKRWTWAGIFALILMIVSVPVIDCIGVMKQSDEFVGSATCLMGYYTIFAVVCAVGLFITFLNMKFYSKAINWIASSVISVYILHDNILSRFLIWKYIYPNNEYMDFPYIHSVIKVAAVFIVGLIIDKVRVYTIGNRFEQWFYRNCDEIIDRQKRYFRKLRQWRRTNR